jgi:hypothetical protein
MAVWVCCCAVAPCGTASSATRAIERVTTQLSLLETSRQAKRRRGRFRNRTWPQGRCRTLSNRRSVLCSKGSVGSNGCSSVGSRGSCGSRRRRQVCRTNDRTEHSCRYGCAIVNHGDCRQSPWFSTELSSRQARVSARRFAFATVCCLSLRCRKVSSFKIVESSSARDRLVGCHPLVQHPCDVYLRCVTCARSRASHPPVHWPRLPRRRARSA